MTKEQLYEILADVDEQQVAEAHKARKNSKLLWLRRAALAACFCLILGGLLLWKLDHRWPIRIVTMEAQPENGGEEIATIPRWEEMEIYEQYYEIQYNGKRYTTRAAQLSASQLGKELAQVTALGWDEYADLEGKDGKRSTTAHLYELKGIAMDCALALQYEGTEGYYVCVNSSYRPETLGQFINDLNLRENLSFGTVYYNYRKPISGVYTTVQFQDVAAEQIWELLLSSEEALNDHNDLNWDPKKILGISVDVPLLGYRNISISVLEEGYIKTNILDTGKRFYIGEERTQAFVDYVLQECEGYEEILVFGIGEGVPE